MRLKVHRVIYLILLCVLAVGMTTSNAVMNIAWVLLFANWLFEWDMKRKFSDFKHNYVLHAFLVLMALHLVGLLWTDNLFYGLDDIRRKLPLLAIPLVVLTSRPISRRQWRVPAFFYVTTVLVVTAIGFVRYLTIPDLPYRHIVPYISHIRFCLNICFSICILVSSMMCVDDLPSAGRRIALLISHGLLIFWLLFFMLLLQSYTGFVILFVTSIVALLCGWKKIRSRGLRWSLLSAWLLLFLGIGGVCCYFVHEYYAPRLSAAPHKVTANGNPYTYAGDGLIENGSYVNDAVCEAELRAEWPKVSRFPIDSVTATGYPLYPALVRYLNAMGVTKDSSGVACLRPVDIRAIEQGVGNPIYLTDVSLRKMFYVRLFEYESYKAYHSVSNFTMLQRFELWKTGWAVFRQNWIYGTGTGDVVDQCHTQLCRDNSPLAGTSKHTHNQYLTLLVTFGAIGAAVVVFAFVWAICRRRLFSSVLWASCFVIIVISFLTEDTVETLAGAVFVAFFFCLLSQFARPSQPKVKPAAPPQTN